MSSCRCRKHKEGDSYASDGLSPEGGQGPDTKNGYYVEDSRTGNYSDVWGLQRLVPNYNQNQSGADKTLSSGYQSMSVDLALDWRF